MRGDWNWNQNVGQKNENGKEDGSEPPSKQKRLDY